MIANLIHGILGLTGLLLLYAGLFLTETEEGKLQNRLEELWVRVDDLQTGAMTKQAALLQQVAGLAADGLDNVFGLRAFSLRSAASCFCFSLASMYLSLALFENELPILTRPILLVLSIVFLISGLSKNLRYLSFAVVLFGALIQLLRLLKGPLTAFQTSSDEVIYTALIYAVALIFGMTYVAFVRRSLRLASRMTRTPTLLAIILGNVASGLVLMGLLLVKVYRYQILPFGPRIGPNPLSRPHALLLFLYNISSATLFIAVVAFLVVFVLLVVLVHKLLWPTLSRPIYAAHRHGLIAQHKLLTALGATCLLLAWPSSLLVKAIAHVIHLGE